MSIDIEHLTIETEVETDGRWLAEVIDVPGAMAYGASKSEAIAAAKAIALRVLNLEAKCVAAHITPRVSK